MPFIAVVYVRDGHTADAIVERYSRGDAGRIVALYEFPDRSELHPGCKGCTQRKVVGWGRHRKGYVACSTCGGRHPDTRRRFVAAMFDWFGANLLGNNAPALFRTPEGYGVPSHADND